MSAATERRRFRFSLDVPTFQGLLDTHYAEVDLHVAPAAVTTAQAARQVLDCARELAAQQLHAQGVAVELRRVHFRGSQVMP